jgi:isocitrate dehydrogenase (NAD+)
MTPGANFGDDRAIFKAVHVSAPDIAGQNKANPLALLMSAVMMLRHLAESSGDTDLNNAADRIKQAYDYCLKHGEKTGDLGGTLSTSEFADAIIARL